MLSEEERARELEAFLIGYGFQRTEPVQEAVKEVVEEPVKEPVKEPLQEAVKEVVEEPVKEAVKEVVEEPVKEQHVCYENNTQNYYSSNVTISKRACHSRTCKIKIHKTQPFIGNTKIKKWSIIFH